ncbi:MAG: DUF4474 domain-containing protein [Lachnospiraceae bacterium]|nr:DUF4474 domain-containing protein [Lachnospiraceae bacterium]
MYLLFGLLFALCGVFFLFHHSRKKKILEKLRAMEPCEKNQLINELARPFGFSYLCREEIMTSAPDAWQRQFGYCARLDRAAPHFNMIFDCEPIYFSYEGRTWLIEFWKGQYGINTGAEIGIYRADTLLSPDQYDKAMFHSISDRELLPLSMELSHCGKKLFSVRETHWWLTGFRMGSYARPGNLTLNCSLTFPDHGMLQSFVEGMLQAGYQSCEFDLCCQTVFFCFSSPKTKQPKASRILIGWSSFQNRLFCRLYRIVTRPCTCTIDRILYLYYYLPAAFRHMLRLKKGGQR